METIKTERKFKEVLLHFRQHREVVKEEEGKTTLEFVLKNNGGYTVLVRKDVVDNMPVFAYSIARCGKSDNFNRSVGAAVARGRFECKDKERRKVYYATTPEMMVHELQYLTKKTKEMYSREFLELLVKRLV